jgi:hypothetical protein
MGGGRHAAGRADLLHRQSPDGRARTARRSRPSRHLHGFALLGEALDPGGCEARRAALLWVPIINWGPRSLDTVKARLVPGSIDDQRFVNFWIVTDSSSAEPRESWLVTNVRVAGSRDGTVRLVPHSITTSTGSSREESPVEGDLVKGVDLGLVDPGLEHAMTLHFKIVIR